MSGVTFPPRARSWTALAALLAALAACEGGSTTPAGPDAAAVAGPTPGPQVPPIGQAAIEPWLAAEHYRGWKCEGQIFSARGNGAHGRHRICSNDLLLASAAGNYPVGAASVKELFDVMDKPNGYAVGLKIAEGAGQNTWYWYERTGRLATLQPVADGVGAPVCFMCHAAAPRDNVFIRAQ